MATEIAGEQKPEEIPTSMELMAEQEAPRYGGSSRWEKACRMASGAMFPPSDKPNATQRAGVGKGDAKRFYYGIGVPKDYVRARHAAFSEWEGGEVGVFGGDAILMMLYANGLAVNRDLDLAIKLACEVDGAPAEVRGRVLHLVPGSPTATLGHGWGRCVTPTYRPLHGRPG